MHKSPPPIPPIREPTGPKIEPPAAPCKKPSSNFSLFELRLDMLC